MLCVRSTATFQSFTHRVFDVTWPWHSAGLYLHCGKWCTPAAVNTRERLYRFAKLPNSVEYLGNVLTNFNVYKYILSVLQVNTQVYKSTSTKKHLKCWFWSTYANCCNFPDEAPFWYLDVAKIVLHFLCGPLCHLHRVVSAQSATESRQNCKQIASDCQHCEKVNCLQIYLNHWPIFISYGTWYSWLLNWRPFLLCSALWCDGKQSLPDQLPFFSSTLLH